MNYNQKFQGHKCSGCYRTIPTGFETPCWTTASNKIYNQLFCSLCMQIRRGRQFSEPYSDLNHLGLEKMERMDTPEFKGYMETIRVRNLNKEEQNKKELEEELERIRWGLPKTEKE